MNLSILGAGAWGTALGIALAPHHRVTLWTRSPAHAQALRDSRENHRYLPGRPLPAALTLTAALDEALAGCERLLVTVPTAGLRAVLGEIAAAGCSVPLVWGCKGFEPGTAKLPHRVVADVLGDAHPCGALSGPSFADEVARGLPTALTLASANLPADFAQGFHSQRLRIYSTTDLHGVEIAGALKNVIAIAAGISDGMHFGLNARAALIARGLAEMSRLGVAVGGHRETFMGLAGAGDLVLTCTGDLSRNRTVGLRLARGESLAHILETLGHTAEGVSTAREVRRLARQHGVDMPISEAVCQILHDGTAPLTAVKDLLSREPRAES